MPQIAAVIGAVATVAGTVASIKGQKKAAGIQRQQQAVATRQSRRQAIRQAQFSRAQSVATASATGAEGSSAALGGQGSIGSQLGSQFGFSTQMSGLSAQLGAAQSSVARSNAIASIGGTAFNFGASRGGLNFLQPKPTSPADAIQPTRNPHTA